MELLEAETFTELLTEFELCVVDCSDCVAGVGVGAGVGVSIGIGVCVGVVEAASAGVAGIGVGVGVGAGVSVCTDAGDAAEPDPVARTVPFLDDPTPDDIDFEIVEVAAAGIVAIVGVKSTDEEEFRVVVASGNTVDTLASTEPGSARSPK